MNALKWTNPVSVEDYLRGELESEQKHEYVAGTLYAMGGGRNRHNLVATNLTGVLWSLLKGRPCRAYNSDSKIRLRLPAGVRFYYPDASVVCRSNPDQDTFQDEPSLIAEVLSKSTRRLDQGEKKEAYLLIPTLHYYLLIESEGPFVTLYRRLASGFQKEVIEGLDSHIALPELGIEVPLAEIYADVKFK
jgi:Uma2 family endonuclease